MARTMRRSRAGRVAWTALCLGLAVTGLGQMPIFKRYYVSDLPGMAWTADYALTHTLHYLLAAVFLAVVGAWLGKRLFARGWGLTTAGRWRFGLVTAVAVTGLVRVAKNQPDVWFSPFMVMLVDWGHLFAVVAFGVLALVVLARGTRYEEAPRQGGG